MAEGIVEGELHEIKQDLPEKSKFMLSFEQINKTIGQVISRDDIHNILTGLEIKIEHSNEKLMLIEIPRYRVDVTRPADVIEEILRLYGYNNILISEMLNTNMPNFENLDDHQISERISNQLVSLGFNEMINNSLDYMNWMNVALDYNDSFYEVVISGKKSFEMAQKITEMYLSLIHI